MAETPPKRRKRVRFWPGLTLIALALLALPALYLGSSSRVEAELTRLREEGILCDSRDLEPVIPPGKANAADLYPQALRALHISPIDIPLDWRQGNATGQRILARPVRAWTPQQRVAVKELLGRNAPAFALRAEAARAPDCAWTDSRPPYYELGEAADWFTLWARLQAADGRADDALATLGVAFRMGEHEQTAPTHSSQHLGSVIYLSAVKDLQEVLSVGDPSPAACRALYDQLGAIPQDETWVRAMKHGFALDVDKMEQLRRGAISPKALVRGGNRPTFRDLIALTYPTAGRPLLDRDEVRYLRRMEQMIEVADKPWVEAKQVVELLPENSGPLAALLHNYYDFGSQRAHEYTAAHLGGARIALALKAYHSEHGTYPRDLATLERAGWKLPLDPFTQQPYRYQQLTPGFQVSSPGPGGKLGPEQPACPGVSFGCER